jgi:hypothetical protein
MAWNGWYDVIWYSIMEWNGMVWYGMVWYGMVWYGTVWYGMVIYTKIQQPYENGHEHIYYWILVYIRACS